MKATAAGLWEQEKDTSLLVVRRAPWGGGEGALGEVKEGQLLIQQREAESVLQAERAVGAKVLR